MTDLGVSVCSRITFGKNTETFILPFPIILEPALILDDKEGVYRISIGMMNDVAEQEQYQRLFTALDKRMPFVENMYISVADEELIIKFAYITRSTKSYGIFYDIEAIKDDIDYKGKE